jgi:hypothetical protein
MKSTAINNIEDLRAEIRRLSTLEEERRVALGYRFSSPSAIFSSALTLFPKSAAAQSVANHGFFHPDLLSLASRFLIPLTLNKTLFRHSNFLVKLLVGVVSQKASGYVTESVLEKLLAQGKSLIAGLITKNKHYKEPLITARPAI